MRVQVIRHISFEGPGAIALWAEERGYALAQADLSLGQALPSLDSFDLLVLMGGPMSVNDEERFAWLRPEKTLVREALAAGKKVLGVCLGAQMIASALGQRVYPNAEPEIGWFPIERTPAGEEHPLAKSLPASLEVLHWHGETFDLPEQAIHLYSTSVCRHQAFAIGSQALALQFHLEATEASLQAMVDGCRDELRSGKPYVQSEEKILGQKQGIAKMRPYLFELLDALVS